MGVCLAASGRADACYWRLWGGGPGGGVVVAVDALLFEPCSWLAAMVIGEERMEEEDEMWGRTSVSGVSGS